MQAHAPQAPTASFQWRLQLLLKLQLLIYVTITLALLCFSLAFKLLQQPISHTGVHVSQPW